MSIIDIFIILGIATILILLIVKVVDNKKNESTGTGEGGGVESPPQTDELGNNQ